MAHLRVRVGPLTTFMYGGMSGAWSGVPGQGQKVGHGVKGSSAIG